MGVVASVFSLIYNDVENITEALKSRSLTSTETEKSESPSSGLGVHCLWEVKEDVLYFFFFSPRLQLLYF